MRSVEISSQNTFARNVMWTCSYLNARLFAEFHTYSWSWLKDARFLTGFILYEFGFWLLVHSDSVLRNLRPKGTVIDSANRYKIPYGGGFTYVTNPQYFG